MQVEILLLVVNVLWMGLMLYGLLRPKAARRAVKDVLKETGERLKARRQLRAKTPAACALCCTEQAVGLVERPTPLPYWQRKSKRGRKKTIRSEGYACLRLDCPYFLVTSEAVHALVCDGQHGQGHDIQRWLCQWCGHTYTARHGTALFRLKKPQAVVEIALKLLCKGMTGRDIAEVIGVDEATVGLWLARAGSQAQRQHEQVCRNLTPAVVQLDELQGRLRGALKLVWIWVAIDAQTKLILELHVGSRKTEAAMTFVHRLAHRLQPGHLPLFLSDGLAAYFYALSAHFGTWQHNPDKDQPVWQVNARLVYAQLIKVTRWRRLLAAFPRAVCGTVEQARQLLRQAGFSGKIQTAFIERVNLTLRQGIAPLARHCWAPYRSSAPLLSHLELYRAYYHFIRPHQSLTVAKRERTPAMAAGLTDHRWTFHEWLTRPVYPI